MFKQSYRIGSLFGIPVQLHISFLLVLPFLAWAIGNNIQYISGYANVPVDSLVLNPYLLGLILAILLFFTVTLHEISHSLVARKQGMTSNFGNRKIYQ